MFQAVYKHLDFVCTVPVTSTILVPTQMWPENKVSRVWEEFMTLKSFLELYTVQLGFYGISSLHIAFSVSILFIVVVYLRNGLNQGSRVPKCLD